MGTWAHYTAFYSGKTTMAQILADMGRSARVAYSGPDYDGQDIKV